MLDDVRQIFHTADPTTAQEIAQAAREARTDPAQARRLVEALYTLSAQDNHAAVLLKLFLEGALMFIVEKLAEDEDAYALVCGTIITDLMDQTVAPPRLRGKNMRKARSA